MTVSPARLLLCLLPGLIAAVGLSACRSKTSSVNRSSSFEAFIPLYNNYIRTFLKESEAQTEEIIRELEGKLSTATGTEAETLAIRLEARLKERETWKFRQSIGDYFQFADPAKIPDGLNWQNGMDEPDIGDPRAVKGGTYRLDIPSFPPTLRAIGSNSNHSLRGDFHDNIDINLLGMHPETLGYIPGLAKEWALSADGRTTYFRLNPAATYSDGTPVVARDFLRDAYVKISDNIVNPYTKQYYREVLAQITIYDEHTLSVTLSQARLYAELYAGSLSPAHPEFYAEYGPDYEERYQWRHPPTTGAYYIKDEDVIKGVSVTQTRVKDWWAKDLKYYRYRFNPDKITYVLVRDQSKAFELFRAGELDSFHYTRSDRGPNYWYEKSEIDEVYHGYIERFTFFKQYPKIPIGLYLNIIKPPLDDRDVRIGIDHSLNWQKVINVMFRGDAGILNAFNEGYKIFSDPTLRARPYSIDEARACFARAGYTEEGRDGILTKPDGTRLAVTISYKTRPLNDGTMSILREDARACGLDLRLDGQEPTVNYKTVVNKQHQAMFGGWVITPPTPRYYDYLHSINSFDDKGNPKPQTNNVFSWARPDTDRLSEATRNARTAEEMAAACHKLQHIMHDEALFLPGFSVDFERVGCWRWVRWPDCEQTRFSPPLIYEPNETHVYWIDKQMQRETREARRHGKTFPEVNQTVDAYRTETAPTPPELAPPTIPTPPDFSDLPQAEIPQEEIPQAEIPEQP